jgi:hypothetical protein
MLHAHPGWDQWNGGLDPKAGSPLARLTRFVQAAAPLSICDMHPKQWPYANPYLGRFCYLTWARDGSAAAVQTSRAVFDPGGLPVCLHPSVDTTSISHHEEDVCRSTVPPVVQRPIFRSPPSSAFRSSPSDSGEVGLAMSPSDRLSPPRPPA